MPRRADIESICLIGSGPIVIGQACEFDYAGCQALKVLREEGFRTIVCNSNPATIMTDPGFADRTYIEPLDLESVASVLRRERPDALLPTLGGQTALNLAIALAEEGILDELGVELIGAPVEVIRRAEDRELFRDAVRSCGLEVPASTIVTSLAQLDELAVPAVVRPAFTLGGHGGGFADDPLTLAHHVERGLWESPIGQVLVEESVRGWDEFELEVMRDRADNVVIVCSIENLDPMGVHTGDSVTVAPQMTLSDEAYQELRDAARAIIRAVGVETGGSNIQFARDRETGDLRVIEMNPRVSRSSALASKATGYPIAKVAAKLAVGYTLDEIPNDLTKTTPGELRADARLRRRQVPTLRVREVPGRRRDPRHADEVGRRGDGHRAHVLRGAAQGARLARARAGRADAVAEPRGRRPAGGTPSVVPGGDRACPRGARLRRHRARETRGLGRRHARRGSRRLGSRGAPPSPRAAASGRRSGASTRAPAR